MASAWITARTTKHGDRRYRVEFRCGGRESATRYGGSFPTKREALLRKAWIAGELAQLRVPDLRALETPRAPTIAEAAKRWQASRVDVAEATRVQHRSSLSALLPLIGTRRVDDLSAADVADLIAELAKTRKKETIRKQLVHLAMVFDHAGVSPNPARGARLPFEQKRELQPPTADHVEAVHRLLPSRYKLPLLVLDATGMRLGELEGLAWGDVDEQRGRWRVSVAVSKTSRARWVSVPPTLFEAVTALVPRDDRTPERPVFEGFGGDRFRTAIARACTAAFPPSRRTTCGTAASRSSTSAECRRRGADRRACRAAQPRGHGEHVHARPYRRGRARIRENGALSGVGRGIKTLVIAGGNSMTEIVFLKDKEWSVIDGELCRVKVFTPLARVEDGRVIALDRTTPYASIVIECTKLPQDATGYITNRLDLLHLWSAFNERGVGEDEEVLVFWTRKNYKTYARLLPSFGMPKLWVMVYRAGAYEMWTDPQVETTSEGLQTLAQWKPDVMV